MTTQNLEGPWRGKPMNDLPKGIIIHAMGEYVNHLYAPDFVQSVGQSVHAFVAVDGKVLFASGLDRIAYHVGKGVFEDIENVNDTFLGVEMLVAGHHNMATFRKAVEDRNDPFSEEQYAALGELCAGWITQFDIERRLILGHAQVSGPDVRKDPKLDPGAAFNWEKLNVYVNQFLAKPTTNGMAEADEE